MKAVTFNGGKIEQREIELPSIPPLWTRVMTVNAGLCGSDVAKLTGTSLPSVHTQVLGHEFIGRVVDLGDNTGDIATGDLVTAMPLIACGRCYACRHHRENLCIEANAIGRTFNGAFAEYVDVPFSNLINIEGATSPISYVLVDPLAVCIHAKNLSASSPDQTCLVIGDGAIGCLLAWSLQQCGFDTWIKGIHSDNLRFIERLGVKTSPPKPPEDHFDVVYETIGRSQDITLHESVRSVRRGGKVVVIGVFSPGYTYPLIARNLFIKEVCLIGSNAYVPDEFKEAIGLIEAHQSVLSSFISHRFPLSRFDEALIVARQKQSFTMKIVLETGGYSS